MQPKRKSLGSEIDGKEHKKLKSNNSIEALFNAKGLSREIIALILSFLNPNDLKQMFGLSSAWRAFVTTHDSNGQVVLASIQNNSALQKSIYEKTKLKIETMSALGLERHLASWLLNEFDQDNSFQKLVDEAISLLKEEVAISSASHEEKVVRTNKLRDLANKFAPYLVVDWDVIYKKYSLDQAAENNFLQISRDASEWRFEMKQQLSHLQTRLKHDMRKILHPLARRTYNSGVDFQALHVNLIKLEVVSMLIAVKPELAVNLKEVFKNNNPFILYMLYQLKKADSSAPWDTVKVLAQGTLHLMGAQSLRVLKQIDFKENSSFTPEADAEFYNAIKQWIVLNIKDPSKHSFFIEIKEIAFWLMDGIEKNYSVNEVIRFLNEIDTKGIKKLHEMFEYGNFDAIKMLREHGISYAQIFAMHDCPLDNTISLLYPLIAMDGFLEYIIASAKDDDLYNFINTHKATIDYLVNEDENNFQTIMEEKTFLEVADEIARARYISPVNWSSIPVVLQNNSAPQSPITTECSGCSVDPSQTLNM